MSRYVITITPERQHDDAATAQTTVRIDTSSGRTLITELHVRAADGVGLAPADLPSLDLEQLVRALAPRESAPAVEAAAPALEPAAEPQRVAADPSPGDASAADGTHVGSPTPDAVDRAAQPSESPVEQPAVPPSAVAQPASGPSGVEHGQPRTTDPDGVGARDSDGPAMAGTPAQVDTPASRKRGGRRGTAGSAPTPRRPRTTNGAKKTAVKKSQPRKSRGAEPRSAAPEATQGAGATTGRSTADAGPAKAGARATDRDAGARSTSAGGAKGRKATAKTSGKARKATTEAAAGARRTVDSRAAAAGSARSGTKAATKTTPKARATKRTAAKAAPAKAAKASTAKAARGRTAKAPGAPAEPTGRAYRRMPAAEDVLAIYRQTGTITGVAEHLGVPRHTVAGWARRLREQGHSIGRP